MRKVLIVLLLFISTCTFLRAQEKKTVETVSKKEAVVSKKAKSKVVEKNNVCHLSKDDELRSLAEGKLTHPGSIPGIKKEIAQLTSCAVENIKVISGGDSGNTAEYIACVCGTKMIYKADYPMKIKTVTPL